MAYFPGSNVLLAAHGKEPFINPYPTCSNDKLFITPNGSIRQGTPIVPVQQLNPYGGITHATSQSAAKGLLYHHPVPTVHYPVQQVVQQSSLSYQAQQLQQQANQLQQQANQLQQQANQLQKQVPVQQFYTPSQISQSFQFVQPSLPYGIVAPQPPQLFGSNSNHSSGGCNPTRCFGCCRRGNCSHSHDVNSCNNCR
jgi:hypothetical protein